MRHAFVDEPFFDIPLCLIVRRDGAANLGFLLRTIRGIGKQILRIFRSHQPHAGQRQRHT